MGKGGEKRNDQNVENEWGERERRSSRGEHVSGHVLLLGERAFGRYCFWAKQSIQKHDTKRAYVSVCLRVSVWMRVCVSVCICVCIHACSCACDMVCIVCDPLTERAFAYMPFPASLQHVSTDRHADKHTRRQTGTQTDRHTDRHADRQTRTHLVEGAQIKELHHISGTCCRKN